jgi:hypothetical protein
VQSTGFLVDFYFYAPANPGQPIDPVVIDLRRKFWSDLQAAPPQVFVITNKVFPGDSYKYDTFDKLKRWPQFNLYLDEHYNLLTERSIPGTYSWSTHPEAPASYRMYVRKP